MRRPGLYLAIPIAGLLLSGLPLSSCGVKVQGTDGDDDASEVGGDDDMTYSAPTPTPTAVPVPQFDIAVSPVTLKFGSVQVSTGKTLELTYTNQGTQTVHLDHLVLNSSTPEFFTFDPLSQTALDPGQSLVVAVTFRPAYTGNYNAVLSLVTEETTAPSTTMSGRGVTSTGVIAE